MPVVNVDGFQISRSAAPLGNFSTFDYEMKRKNCTISAATPAQYRTGTCADNLAGRLRGTDPNRNYPGFWGGPGASTSWSSDTFRGDAPGDTPEVDNIKRLISERQVTNLISNHTYSNLVLRPPSLLSTGYSPDEPVYKALGASMTAANDYTNWAVVPAVRHLRLGRGLELLADRVAWASPSRSVTSASTRRTSTAVVAEYLGLEPAAGAGQGGNREAYYRMAEATMDAGLHSTITGTAPAGHVLTVSKQFQAMTSPVIQPNGTVGAPIPYENELASSLRGTGGKFSWAVNPSTRPRSSAATAVTRWPRPSRRQTLTNPAGIPAEGQSETARSPSSGLPQYDNGRAEVRVQWPDAGVDWDVYVYDSAGNPVASAASLADPEVAVILDPLPGTYTVVVENYDGGTTTSDWTGEVVFGSPTPASYSGIKEAWNLTCSKNGRHRRLGPSRSSSTAAESVDVGNACKKAKD